MTPVASKAAGNASLAIVQAGVQQADDAPFVPSDYRFYPGDYIFFTFEVSGFAIKSNADGTTRSMSLTYQVTPEDMHGVPLSAPNSGVIKDELAPEDKNWTPKRRASFLLPSDIAAGQFRIHLIVNDTIAKSEVERDVPFNIGGTAIEPASALTLERFQFFRGEKDSKPLELPAYARGDSVFMRFDLVGFQTGAHNEYHLSYGIQVLSPDGRVYLDQPKAAEITESDFYPAQFVPANLRVNTSAKAELGQYTILLTVRDLVGNQTYETKQAFTVE
jgi:hypothetical protein